MLMENSVSPVSVDVAVQPFYGDDATTRTHWLDELDHAEVRVLHFKKSYHSVRLNLERKIPRLFGIFRLLFIQDAGILWRIEKEARGNFVHIVNCSIRVNALLVVDAFDNLKLLCKTLYCGICWNSTYCFSL
jgi:hypothetical protein